MRWWPSHILSAPPSCPQGSPPPHCPEKASFSGMFRKWQGEGPAHLLCPRAPGGNPLPASPGRQSWNDPPPRVPPSSTLHVVISVSPIGGTHSTPAELRATQGRGSWGRAPGHLPRDTLIPLWGRTWFETNQKHHCERQAPRLYSLENQWGRKASTFQTCPKISKDHPAG